MTSAIVTYDPIDMESFENAVHSWFSDATGLVTVWREQSTPQPKLPFGSLLITTGPEPVAPQWEWRYDTDLGRPAGSEVRVTSGVPCQFTVSCQTYVGQPDGKNPQVNARYYINRALGDLQKFSVLTDLHAAGVGLVRTGGILNISEVIEDAYVSRANTDVTFGATLSIEEYIGYIEKIHAISTELGIDQEFGVGV